MTKYQYFEGSTKRDRIFVTPLQQKVQVSQLLLLQSLFEAQIKFDYSTMYETQLLAQIHSIALH